MTEKLRASSPKLQGSIKPQAPKLLGASALKFRAWSFARVWGLVLGASLCAAEPSLTPVRDPRPILQDLQHKMSSLPSVYFEFTQERQLKLFAEPLRSDGVMLIERPDQIRWETTEP